LTFLVPCGRFVERLLAERALAVGSGFGARRGATDEEDDEEEEAVDMLAELSSGSALVGRGASR